MSKSTAIVTSLFFGSLLMGCEKGHDLPLVPVSGRVSFNHGSPPAEGNVSFVQVGNSGPPGLTNRPGRATFGTDGRFAATTFQNEDGLLPGKYQVAITCVDAEAKPGQPFDEVSFVPSTYRPDQFVVEEG